MWRRLLAINISNTAAALAGFGVNYFLVKLIGMDGFGEFSVLLARLNLLFLAFVLLPQSYAIFKLQDLSDFKHVFLSFSCYVNMILGVAVFVLIKDAHMRWVLLFYVLTNGLQTYADTVLQAIGNTRLFFRLLMISSLVKFLLLGTCYLVHIQVAILDVWLIIGIGQMVFAYIIIIDRKQLKSKIVGITSVVNYIKVNFKLIKEYYLYVGLKRIQDNSPLLIFDLFISKEAIGMFSLLLKPLIFFVSLIRTFESFLTSRENFAAFHKVFKSRVAIISIILFGAFVPFCTVYMYLYTGDFSFVKCLILSVLIPLFVAGTLARIEHLASYNQSYLNISCLIFIFTNLLLGSVFYLSNVTGVYPVLIAYVVCNVLSLFYLISKNNSNEKVVL